MFGGWCGYKWRCWFQLPTTSIASYSTSTTTSPRQILPPMASSSDAPMDSTLFESIPLPQFDTLVKDFGDKVKLPSKVVH